MEEDEHILDFQAKFQTILNEISLLGEHYPERKMVRKILRSLSERFDYKVVAIEEASDLDPYSSNDLFSTLLIFEMGMHDNKSAKNK